MPLRQTGGIGALNEIQVISVSGAPATGTFDVTFQGETATLDYDESAANAETKLESLSSIGSGNVNVTGGSLPGVDLTVEFIGTLAATPLPEVTVDDTKLVSAIAETVKGDPGANEVQRLTTDIDAHDGTYTLTYSGQTSGNLDWDSTAAEVEAALELLSNIDAVAVTGGPFPSATLDVEFQGTLALTNVAAMTSTPSLDNGTVTITTTQFTLVTTTTNSEGPNHWDVAANWEPSGVPATADDVIVDGGSSILYGLSQGAVLLDTLTITGMFTKEIGLPAT